MTALALEQGWRARGHAVSWVRPRQVPGQVPAADETLVRGANLPRYPGLKFGLPATRQLRQLWRDERPDAIYVATEGPLGWRSEEHTSELQSLMRISYAVFCLKTKNNNNNPNYPHHTK